MPVKYVSRTVAATGIKAHGDAHAITNPLPRDIMNGLCGALTIAYRPMNAGKKKYRNIMLV